MRDSEPSLWAVAAWPYSRLGRLRSPGEPLHSRSWRAGNLWRFAWQTQPYRHGSLALLAFLHFCLDLYLALVMSALLVAPERTALAHLIGLLAGRVGLWWLKGVIDAQVYRHNCRLVTGRLQTVDVGTERRDKLHRVLSVDVPHFLEGLRVTYTFVHIGASLLAGTAVLIYLGGASAVLAVLAIAGFVPLTLLISSKRSALNRRLFHLVQRRAATASAWLQHETRLRAWGRADALTSRLQAQARAEARARTADGAWRALDVYAAAFGKVVPVSVVLLGAALLSARGHDQALATLWVVIFIVNMLLQISRYRPIFALGQAAFESLRQLPVRQLNGDELIFDDTWDIWEGTLGDNVRDDTGLRFAREFGLDHELGESGFADHYLQGHGRDVSNGQRTRILLARALSVAHEARATTLRVHRSLATLDPAMRRTVVQVLHGQSEVRVVLESPGAPSTPYQDNQVDDDASHRTRRGQRAPTSGPTARTQAAPSRERMSLTFKKLARVKPCLLMAIVPLLLVLSGSVANAQWAAVSKSLSLLGLGFVGAFLGVAIAVWIELGVRRWARRHFARQLTQPTSTSHADQLQRLTRDYTNVVGRIASYVHDLTWFGFLWLITLVGVILAFPLVGALLSLVTATSYGWIWWRLAPSLVTARRALVTGLNRYIDRFDDAAALGRGAAHPVLARSFESCVQDAVSTFYVRNVEQILVKHSVRTMAVLSSAVCILAFCAAASWLPGHVALMSLAATGLLNLDLRVGVLFAGLAGFEALRESALRLERQAPTDATEEPVIRLACDDDRVLVPALDSPLTYATFCPWQLSPGQVTSLVGPSGSGKSVYCGLLARDRQHVLYLGAGAPEALRLLARGGEEPDAALDMRDAIRSLCRERLDEGTRVIIFDEALAQLSPVAVLELAESVASGPMHKSAVLLVDHRVTATRSVLIDELAAGS